MGHEDCKTVGGVPAPIPVDDCGDLIDVAASSGGMETVSTAFNRRLAQQISAAVDPIWKHLGAAPPDVPSRKHAERGDDWHEQIAREEIRDFSLGSVQFGHCGRVIGTASRQQDIRDSVCTDIRAWFVVQLERAGRRAASIERRRIDESWARPLNEHALKMGYDLKIETPNDLGWFINAVRADERKHARNVESAPNRPAQ